MEHMPLSFFCHPRGTKGALLISKETRMSLMKSVVPLIFGLCAAVSLGTSGVLSEEVWTVTRSIPAPTAVSQELHDAIAATPQPPTEKALPSTVQGWVDMSTANSEAFAVMARSIAEQWNVTIEAAEIAGVKVYWVTPAEVAPQNKDRLFISTHGGGFSMGFGFAATFEAINVAHYAKIPVISIDYRTIPLHPYPAALNDVLAVYKELLKDHNPAAMAIGGGSAGGNLSMASIHKFKIDGLPVPAAYFGATPWADLAKVGDSYFTNEGIDRILPVYEGELGDQAKMYAGGEDMTNPLLSPVYGDFSTFPPAQLVTGTRDLFLSNTVRVHRKIREAGGIADLNVYEGISHGEFIVYTHMPENAQVFTELGAFLDKHLK